MAHHIAKVGTPLEPNKTIYYKGDQCWTDVYEDRKIYATEASATKELHVVLPTIWGTRQKQFGGTVVSE